MSVDKFGRDGGSSSSGARGPPGIGFKIIADGKAYDISGKRLFNVADPIELHNAVTLQYFQSHKYTMDKNRLKFVNDPIESLDAVNKSYVDGKIKELKTTFIGVHQKLNNLSRDCSKEVDATANLITHKMYVEELINKVKSELEAANHQLSEKIDNLSDNWGGGNGDVVVVETKMKTDKRDKTKKL